MNIVSSADANFFHCAVELAKSVRKFYDRQLILYDVGLTEEQRNNIDARVIPINVAVSFSTHAATKYGSFVQSTHKPSCVQHYFSTTSEPMIFLDADCLFTQRVEEHGFDVGVTLRSQGRDKSNKYNGLLNAGVIFFNTCPVKLIEKWVLECAKDNTTDQKALCDILSETIDWDHYNKIYDWYGVKIKVFGTDEYNDYHLKNGKILHFKGRRHETGIYESLIKGLDEGKDIYSMFKEMTGEKTFLHRILPRFLRRRTSD